jgi:hypothetical protein
LIFVYPIYNYNWRNISTISVYIISKITPNCTISLKAAVLPGLISGRALVKKNPETGLRGLEGSGRLRLPDF